MSIAVLVSARADSRWLAGCVASYRYWPGDDTEMLVSVPEADWRMPDGSVRYIARPWHRGRGDLHRNFNALAEQTDADWLLTLCDDMVIVSDRWVSAIREAASELDPWHPWCLAPPFDNAGPVAHVISRGWIAVLGLVARHPVVDCYIGEVAYTAGVLRTISGPPILHDAGAGAAMAPFDYAAEGVPVHQPRKPDGDPGDGPWWDMVLADAKELRR